MYEFIVQRVGEGSTYELSCPGGEVTKLTPRYLRSAGIGYTFTKDLEHDSDKAEDKLISTSIKIVHIDEIGNIYLAIRDTFDYSVDGTEVFTEENRGVIIDGSGHDFELPYMVDDEVVWAGYRYSNESIEPTDTSLLTGDKMVTIGWDIDVIFTDDESITLKATKTGEATDDDIFNDKIITLIL